MKSQRSQREAGSNLLETALVIPLLILMVVGVADLGRAFQTHITLLNAAREGARYAVRDSDPVAIAQRVVAEAALSWCRWSRGWCRSSMAGRASRLKSA